jgi:predicted nuclease with TOPRIM domain
MSELEEMMKELEKLRAKLHEITEGKTLTDSEVMVASQMLDAVLNEYYKLLKSKVDGDWVGG